MPLSASGGRERSNQPQQVNADGADHDRRRHKAGNGDAYSDTHAGWSSSHIRVNGLYFTGKRCSKILEPLHLPDTEFQVRQAGAETIGMPPSYTPVIGGARVGMPESENSRMASYA
jgi:hypothetical protein